MQPKLQPNRLGVIAPDLARQVSGRLLRAAAPPPLLTLIQRRWFPAQAAPAGRSTLPHVEELAALYAARPERVVVPVGPRAANSSAGDAGAPGSSAVGPHAPAARSAAATVMRSAHTVSPAPAARQAVQRAAPEAAQPPTLPMPTPPATPPIMRSETVAPSSPPPLQRRLAPPQVSAATPQNSAGHAAQPGDSRPPAAQSGALAHTGRDAAPHLAAPRDLPGPTPAPLGTPMPTLQRQMQQRAPDLPHPPTGRPEQTPPAAEDVGEASPTRPAAPDASPADAPAAGRARSAATLPGTPSAAGVPTSLRSQTATLHAAPVLGPAIVQRARRLPALLAAAGGAQTAGTTGTDPAPPAPVVSAHAGALRPSGSPRLSGLSGDAPARAAALPTHHPSAPAAGLPTLQRHPTALQTPAAAAPSAAAFPPTGRAAFATQGDELLRAPSPTPLRVQRAADDAAPPAQIAAAGPPAEAPLTALPLAQAAATSGPSRAPWRVHQAEAPQASRGLGRPVGGMPDVRPVAAQKAEGRDLPIQRRRLAKAGGAAAVLQDRAAPEMAAPAMRATPPAPWALQRQGPGADSYEPATTPSAAPPAAVAAPPSATPALDLQAVADAVCALIEQRLRVERESRGL